MTATSPRFVPLLACALATAVLAGCGDGTTTPPVTQTNGATTKPTTGTPGNATPAGGTAAVKLPSYWYETDIPGAWTGKKWSEIDLFTFTKDEPEGLDTGTQYVVFFGRTCDHCEEMFNNDFVTNPDLASRVTAIEVPVDKDQLRSEDAWPLPETNCRFGQLRLGPDWIMTTPVTVRLENGIVQCAQEGGHAECMGM